MTIDAYLEAMKERFVTDPLVTHFQVLRARSTLMDGYLRARLTLAEGSQLEFSEYMQRSSAGEIVVITYSYHWPMPTISSSRVGITRRISLIFPTFKGVWSAAAHFVLLPLLDTSPGQYPPRHR